MDTQNKISEGQKLLKEFEETIGFAELRAFSKVSLERPLSDAEFGRMKALAKQLGVGE